MRFCSKTHRSMRFLKNVRAIPRDRFLCLFWGTFPSVYSEGHIPRKIPREPSLGKFRGSRPSENSEELVPRYIPREKFLGINRGKCPSVYSYRSMYICPNTHRSMNFRGIIPTKFSLGIFRGHFRQTSDPRNFLGNLFPRNSDGKFRGISEEKINSEELFPTTCFVGMSSE